MPKFFLQKLIIFFGASFFVTSYGKEYANLFLDFVFIIFSTAFNGFGLLETKIKLHPSSAKSIAMALPRPWLAPVIMQFLFFNL